MIYEILVRGKDNKITSDNLILIESPLTTRSFEKWLLERSLLGSTVLRWSIVQTSHPAHFNLATQEKALEARIDELVTGIKPVVRTQKVVKERKGFQLKQSWNFELSPAY